MAEKGWARVATRPWYRAGVNARGLLIVNEGADGSGKETQTRLLCARLEREGVRVARFSFPTYGEDPVADCIRTMLRERKAEWNARPWESKAVLYASNRKRFAGEIRDRLAEPGTMVICDRYVPSNQAHMAALVEDRGEWGRRFRWIARLEYELLALPRPDIVLLHTMPGAFAQQLLAKRGFKDAHEEDGAYLERVVRCFYLLVAREPEVWRHVAADVGGVLQSPEEVHARVWAALTVHPVWIAFVREAARAVAR